MILPEAEEDKRMRFEPGPYTAVEGYLRHDGGQE